MIEKITYKNFDSLLNRFSTSELEGLVQKFPYFQQGHLLLAKKYQLENHPLFDEQLQMAALYAQNRELLYEIFTKPTVENVLTDELSTIAVETKTDLVEDQNNVVVDMATVEDVLVETPEIEVAEAQENGTNARISEVSSAEEMVEQAQTDFSDLQKSAEVAETKDNDFDVSQPHTYDEWLRAFAYGNGGNKAVKEQDDIEEDKQMETMGTVVDKIEPDELEQLIHENISVDYLHELVEEETHYSKGLDKFIEEQIRKHRHQAEVIKVKDENAIDDDIITETLAKLYESQRKYSKAIRAYEVLIMKYPEKNDLFASRIQYLNKLI